MSYYKAKDEALTATASKIMEKLGSSEQVYFDADTGFADAVDAIIGGGGDGEPHDVRFWFDESGVKTDNSTLLQTVANVPYLGRASFTGTLPSVTGKYFAGWNPYPQNVGEDVDCVTQYSTGQIDASEITDSWETICANRGALYSIGSYKGIVLIDSNGNNLGNIQMQKVYEGEDISTSTWVAMSAMSALRRMHSSNATNGGYPAMELRNYLNNTLFAALPTELKESIVPVMKYSASLISGNWSYAHASQESLWIPSAREVGLGIETNGPVYSQIYNSNAARIKKQGPAGGTFAWWLRSTADGRGFRLVNTSGSLHYYDATDANGVVLGFCL